MIVDDTGTANVYTHTDTIKISLSPDEVKAGMEELIKTRPSDRCVVDLVTFEIIYDLVNMKPLVWYTSIDGNTESAVIMSIEGAQNPFIYKLWSDTKFTVFGVQLLAKMWSDVTTIAGIDYAISLIEETEGVKFSSSQKSNIRAALNIYLPNPLEEYYEIDALEKFAKKMNDKFFFNPKGSKSIVVSDRHILLSKLKGKTYLTPANTDVIIDTVLDKCITKGRIGVDGCLYLYLNIPVETSGLSAKTISPLLNIPPESIRLIFGDAI